MSDNPCWGCHPPKRHVGCHATCPDHIPWKEEKDRQKEIEQLERITYIDDHTYNKRVEAIQSAKYNKNRKG